MAARGETKRKIVDAAWRLFNEKGYQQTTIEDIIAASKTSRGTFYHYFTGKDALLSTLSDLFDEYYRQLIAELPPQLNSFDKLVTLCCRVHEMIGQRIPVALLATLYSSQAVTRGDKHLLNRERYYFRLIRQLMEEGQRRGQITDRLSALEAANYYAMCERAIIYDYCISEGGYDLGEFTASTAPLLLNALRP